MSNATTLISDIKSQLEKLVTAVKTIDLRRLEKENNTLKAKLATLEKTIQDEKTLVSDTINETTYSSEYYILHENTWILIPCTGRNKKDDNLKIIFTS